MSASAITNKKVYKREREKKKLKVWLYITRWIDCHRPATIKGLRSRRYIYTHTHTVSLKTRRRLIGACQPELAVAPSSLYNNNTKEGRRNIKR